MVDEEDILVSSKKPFYKRCGDQFCGIFKIDRWLNPSFKEAQLIAIVGVILTLILFVVGMLVGIEDSSMSLISASGMAIVDTFSSIVVLWRFHGSVKDEERLKLREGRAEVVIAFSLLLLCIMITVSSIYNLSLETKVADPIRNIAWSSFSLVFALLVGVLQVHVGKRVDSGALVEDGVCTLGSGVIYIGSIIGSALYGKDSSLWWIDSMFSLLTAVGFLFYGLYILRSNRGFATKEFWVGKQKLENDDYEQQVEDIMENNLDLDQV